MSRIRAKYVRRSLCPCGFSVLADHVQLGKEYIIHPEAIKALVLVCGGCGRELPVTGVFVEGPVPGYLPREIFDDRE